MDIKHKIDQIALKFFEGNNVRFANKLNSTESNVRNYRNGRSAPKLDFILGLHNELGINYEWLFNDAGNMVMDDAVELTDVDATTTTFTRKGDKIAPRQAVPLYNTYAAAGLLQTMNDNENIIDYISIPNLPKCDAAIYITGDSMYPLLKSGDIAFIKRVNDISNSILWGEMYLLSFIFDDEIYTLAKYIQKSDKGNSFVKLVSQNQHHQPIDIPLNNIKELALIKASVRFNSMN